MEQLGQDEYDAQTALHHVQFCAVFEGSTVDAHTCAAAKVLHGHCPLYDPHTLVHQVHFVLAVFGSCSVVQVADVVYVAHVVHCP